MGKVLRDVAPRREGRAIGERGGRKVWFLAAVVLSSPVCPCTARFGRSDPAQARAQAGTQVQSYHPGVRAAGAPGRSVLERSIPGRTNRGTLPGDGAPANDRAWSGARSKKTPAANISSVVVSTMTNWLLITSRCEGMPCPPRLVAHCRRVWRCFCEKGLLSKICG